MNDAAIQAELMKGFQQPMPQHPPQQQGQPQQAPAGADVADPTGAGGGTIGTGQAPIPGEQGFTGVPQQGGQTNTQPTEAVGQQPQINPSVQ